MRRGSVNVGSIRTSYRAKTRDLGMSEWGRRGKGVGA